MKPKDVLAAKSSATMVLVSGLLDDLIYLIGASLATSARPGDYVRSFAVYLPDDVEFGVVAVSVSSHRFSQKFDRSYPSFPFLLVVRSPLHGEASVDLEEQWISPQPVQVQVYDRYLEAQVGDERFSTLKPYEGNPRQIRYVADANLLCRYLVGAATEDEVRAAAEEAVAEVGRKERIAELEAQVERFETEMQAHKLELIQWRDTAEQLYVGSRRQADELNTLRKSKLMWNTYARRLLDLLHGRRFLGKDLKQAIREFPQDPKPSGSPTHADEPMR